MTEPWQSMPTGDLSVHKDTLKIHKGLYPSPHGKGIQAFSVCSASSGMYFQSAVRADPVEDRSHGIDGKTVCRIDMLLDPHQFVAVEMDQPAAVFAFTVETVNGAALMQSDELITGGVGSSDGIFSHHSLFHQLIQVAVNGRHAHIPAHSPEIIMDLGCRQMGPFPLHQILRQLFLLFCPVTGSACHIGLSLKTENHIFKSTIVYQSCVQSQHLPEDNPPAQRIPVTS